MGVRNSCILLVSTLRDELCLCHGCESVAFCWFLHFMCIVKQCLYNLLSHLCIGLKLVLHCFSLKQSEHNNHPLSSLSSFPFPILLLSQFFLTRNHLFTLKKNSSSIYLWIRAPLYHPYKKKRSIYIKKKEKKRFRLWIGGGRVNLLAEEKSSLWGG